MGVPQMSESFCRGTELGRDLGPLWPGGPLKDALCLLPPKVTPSAGSKLKRPTFHSSRTSLAGDTSNSSSPVAAGAKTSRAGKLGAKTQKLLLLLFLLGCFNWQREYSLIKEPPASRGGRCPPRWPRLGEGTLRPFPSARARCRFVNSSGMNRCRC